MIKSSVAKLEPMYLGIGLDNARLRPGNFNNKSKYEKVGVLPIRIVKSNFFLSLTKGQCLKR